MFLGLRKSLIEWALDSKAQHTTPDNKGKSMQQAVSKSHKIFINLSNLNVVKRQIERVQKYKENPLTVTENFHSTIYTLQSTCYREVLVDLLGFRWFNKSIMFLNIFLSLFLWLTFPVLLADYP